MRLLTTNYEFPPLGGGGGRANAQIARQMALLGHEVIVLTSSFKDLPRKEIRDGYLILRIPTLRRHIEKCRIFEMIVFMVASVFYAIKLVRSWRPDMTIAFFTLPSAPAALVLKKLFRIPYIVSLRGGDVPGFMREQLWLYHSLTLKLIRYIWKEARAVVANSCGLKKLALQAGGNPGITVIPNGVDSGFFRGEHQNAGVKPDSASETPFRILTVGRLTPQKGIDVLLEAFHRIKSCAGKPVQVWIAGDGPLRNTLERLAERLGIGGDVFFFGWQDQENLKNFYSSADLFVLPSIDEGMPNVVLEAMAMGLPVVATDVAGTREIVEDGVNGCIVPPKNPQMLADALLMLVRDDSLSRKMSQASQKIARQYNWKEVASLYLDLCQNPSYT